MLSVSEIVELLKNIPRGFLSPDSEFVKDANEALIPPYKKLGVITDFNDQEETVKQDATTSNSEIHCNVPGCNMVFEGVTTYQAYCNSLHRFSCAECRRSLPTAHLLDLHISERHDSYFAARVARGDVMYSCFLEECEKVFPTPEQRKRHLIEEHKFPANFRYDKMGVKVWTKSGEKETEESDTNVLKAEQEEGAVVMETDAVKGELKSVKTTRKINEFSFGHQKTKTFNTSHKRAEKDASSALAAMGDLADALDDDA